MTTPGWIKEYNLPFAALFAAVAFIPFSILFCHTFLIIFIFLIAIEGDWQRKFLIIRSNLFLQIIIAGFVIQAVGLVFTDDLESGLFVLEKKIFLLLMPVALATSSVLLSRQKVNLLFYVLAVACVFASLYALVSILSNGRELPRAYLPVDFHLEDGDSIQWLMYSYLGIGKQVGLHPTFFSFYVAISMIFLYSELLRVSSKIQIAILLSSIFFLAIVLAMLSSRIVVLGTLVIALITLFHLVVKQRKYFHALPLVGLLALVISTVLLNPVSRYRNIEEFRLSSFSINPGTRFSHSADIRFSLWWLGVESLRNTNPLTGVGTGDVISTVRSTAESEAISNVLDTFDPHNQYLYALLAHGVTGLFILLLMLIVPCYLAWKERGYFLASVIFLFALTCMTESMLELQKGIVFYAIFLPLMCFHYYSFQHWVMNKNLQADARI